MFLFFIYALLAALTVPPARSAELRRIGKVGIVGSGPAGLSLAAALQQLDAGVQEVCIFEGRDSFLQAKMGGGVQLSGGAVVLEKLGCFDQLDSVAQPVTSILARNAQGRELLRVDVQQLLSAVQGGRPMFYSIMRDALQKLLFDMSQSGPTVVKVQGKREVVSLEEDASSGQVAILFADGGREDGFDMVFGADGIKSVVRDAVRGGAKSSAADARYTGIKIVYGVTGRDDAFIERPQGRGAFFQWFGDSAYVLSASYGGLAGVQHMMAIVYRDENRGSETSVTTAENAEWRSSVEKPRSKRAKLADFLSKAGFTASTGLFSLLEACDEDRFVELAVNDRSAPLLGWTSSSGRLVLLGDACHAMAPFLGQGANQALQDSFVLATKVKALNALAVSGSIPWPWAISPITPLQLAMLDYQRIRLLPTAIISIKSGFLGAVETQGGSLGCFARDNFFRLTSFLGVAKLVLLSGALPSIGEK